jgi:hypothetical protein
VFTVGTSRDQNSPWPSIHQYMTGVTPGSPWRSHVMAYGGLSESIASELAHAIRRLRWQD